MTDDSATLRAMAELALATRSAGQTRELAHAVLALLVSQSSWAKEKAELERQLADSDALLFDEIYESMDEDTRDAYLAEAVARHKARHASRPVTAKD